MIFWTTVGTYLALYRESTAVPQSQIGFIEFIGEKCLVTVIKETVSRDCCPQHCFELNPPIWAPDWHEKVFSNMTSILRVHMFIKELWLTTILQMTNLQNYQL